MTAVLCPGQGAQYPGMGSDFAERWPVAREFLTRADEALGLPLSRMLAEGTEEEVNRTDVCQPGILAVSAAVIAVLESEGLLVRAALRFAAGLSLGEYTAHYLAGTFSFEDAVRLVRRRGEAMQTASDATPSGMAAVMGAELDTVEEVCASVRADGGTCVVANLNAPGQIVVSGEQRALATCGERLTAAGAKRFVPLKVAGAFHSPVMQPAADRLAEAIAAVEFRDPRFPVISNVTAEPVNSAADARVTLSRQIVEPVLFERSLGRLLSEGVADFVEPGPGRTAAGFLRRIDRSITVRGYDKAADVAA